MYACVYVRMDGRMYVFMDLCMHDNIQRMFEQENITMLSALNKKLKKQYDFNVMSE